MIPDSVASAAAIARIGSGDDITMRAAGSKNSRTSGATSSSRPTTYREDTRIFEYEMKRDKI